MADVVPPPHRPLNRGELALAAAVAAFLDHADLAATTRRVYHASLAALVDGLGPTRPTPELTEELVEEWFHTRYAAAAPATWNRELATLRSATAWWRAHGWLPTHTDPTAGLARRREHPDRTHALTRGQLEALWRRSDLRLRDKTLWRLLYETAARASEALNLDVGDLDLANKRARVTLCMYEALVRAQQRRPQEATIGILPGAGFRTGQRTFWPHFVITHRGRAGVIEVDGPRHRGRAAADQSRDRRLQDAGVTLIERIVVEDVDQPAELDAFVERFLARLLTR